MSSGLITFRSFFSSSCIYTFRLGYSKNRTRYHQMPFSRYLRLPSQISVPDELDVVEDSEPEREERRMAEIKKHGKQAKRPRQKPTAIIEVSSDESDPHPAGRSQRDPTNKVDVLGGYFPHKKLVSPLQNLFR